MANRYPLILDTTDSNKIKELQTGDNLNLADNSIVGVQNITDLSREFELNTEKNNYNYRYVDNH